MNIAYICFTVYTVLKVIGFSVYKIKEGNVISFVISMFLILSVIITSVIYYI